MLGSEYFARMCLLNERVYPRMESTSKKMKIQCCEKTRVLLLEAPGNKFGMVTRSCGDIVGVDVKGKGLSMT